MAVIYKLDRNVIKFLKDLQKQYFLNGHCYAFAVALHDELGWQIMGLMYKNKTHHAFLRDSGGNFFDARGYVQPEKLDDLFSLFYFLKGQYELKEIKKEDLYRTGTVLISDIDKAKNFAPIIWPGLPWKRKNTRANRIKVFTEELEALGRKHNLWISVTSPETPSLLAEGCGDENYYHRIIYAVERQWVV